VPANAVIQALQGFTLLARICDRLTGVDVLKATKEFGISISRAVRCHLKHG
jgi:hypothetical protein